MSFDVCGRGLRQPRSRNIAADTEMKILRTAPKSREQILDGWSCWPDRHVPGQATASATTTPEGSPGTLATSRPLGPLIYRAHSY